MDEGFGGGRTSRLSGSMSPGTARNGGRFLWAEPVGLLELGLPAEQVMDEGGGGGRTGGLSGSMSTGTARNGGIGSVGSLKRFKSMYSTKVHIKTSHYCLCSGLASTVPQEIRK